MGRYYSGDIEGKFWFGLQPSNAASRFGGLELEPQYIQYFFEEGHLKNVNQEIENIKKQLGDKVEILDKFFEENNGYSDDQIEQLGISMDDLRDYADLDLGIKIRDCIMENDECSFDAEL